jgi:hypothetical protein
VRLPGIHIVKILRVVLHIDNGRRPDVHVQLDTVLPAETPFGYLIELDGRWHVITGLRSPPSAYVTVRPL